MGVDLLHSYCQSFNEFVILVTDTDRTAKTKKETNKRRQSKSKTVDLERPEANKRKESKEKKRQLT